VMSGYQKTVVQALGRITREPEMRRALPCRSCVTAKYLLIPPQTCELKISLHMLTTRDLSAPSSVRVAASLEVIRSNVSRMGKAEDRVCKILSCC
jgi:hypothetical protein